MHQGLKPSVRGYVRASSPTLRNNCPLSSRRQLLTKSYSRSRHGGLNFRVWATHPFLAWPWTVVRDTRRSVVRNGALARTTCPEALPFVAPGNEHENKRSEALAGPCCNTAGTYSSVCFTVAGRCLANYVCCYAMEHESPSGLPWALRQLMRSSVSKHTDCVSRTSAERIK